MKDGNPDCEYEDALAYDPVGARFAIADGASESVFASLWAGILTQGFVSASVGQGPREWLETLQKQWCESVPWAGLPWYGRKKALLGSFCAFLGLWFHTPTAAGEVAWRAVAIGDCCLFQVRGNTLVSAFPINRSGEFNNRPPLVRSLPLPWRCAVRGLRGLRGCGQAGDRFFLATDALAEWFLRSAESHEAPWDVLAGIGTVDHFRAWVAEQRVANRMRNDDTSLLGLEVRDELARPV